MFFQSTAPLYPPGLDENGAVANFYPLKQPRQLKNSVPCIGFLYFRGTRQLSNQQIYIFCLFFREQSIALIFIMKHFLVTLKLHLKELRATDNSGRKWLEEVPYK